MHFQFQFLTKNEQINIEIMGVAFTCQDYHAIGTTFWLGNWFTFWFFLITDKLTQRLLLCLIYLAILFFFFFFFVWTNQHWDGSSLSELPGDLIFWLLHVFLTFYRKLLQNLIHSLPVVSLVRLELLWWWWQTKGDDVDDYGGGNDGNVTNVERPMVGCPLLIPFPPRK